MTDVDDVYLTVPLQFQDFPLHNHELRIRQTPDRRLHSIRNIGRGHAQHPVMVLRGILHVPVRHEHPVPPVRLLLPPAREHVLLRGEEGEGKAPAEGEDAQGEEQEEGGQGEGEEEGREQRQEEGQEGQR